MTLHHRIVAFVGAGNMGTALIEGCLRNGVFASDLLVVEPDETRRQALAARGLTVMARPAEPLRKAGLVILGVKPQQMREAVESIASHVDAEVIVSIAAGVTIDALKRWIGKPAMVVRAMPNTPAMIGSGVTGLYTADSLTPLWREVVSSLFDPVGKTLWLSDEVDMDAITAISGSGPAYFFYLMETMILAARQLGFSKETAQMLVKQTALGAAELAVARPEADCSSLREQVTSKGGTTAAALETLDRMGVDRAVVEAVMAAHRRSLEIARQNDEPL